MRIYSTATFLAAATLAACSRSPNAGVVVDAGAMEVLPGDLVVRYIEAVSGDSAAVSARKQALVVRGNEVVDPVAVLLKDPDPRVHEAGADVLEAIGTQLALDRLVDSAVDDFLERRVETEVLTEKRLIRMGKAVVPALDRKFRADPSPYTRNWILHLVVHIGDRTALPLVVVGLEDADSRVAGLAAWILGTLKGPEVCRLLLPLLRSTDANRQAGAIIGLRILGDRGAVEPLVKILLAPDRPIPRPRATMPLQRHMLHDEAAFTIDMLTGEKLGDDPKAVQEWLVKHAPETSCPKE